CDDRKLDVDDDDDLDGPCRRGIANDKPSRYRCRCGIPEREHRILLGLVQLERKAAGTYRVGCGDGRSGSPRRSDRVGGYGATLLRNLVKAISESGQRRSGDERYRGLVYDIVFARV